jgi:hypothetical protein
MSPRTSILDWTLEMTGRNAPLPLLLVLAPLMVVLLVVAGCAGATGGNTGGMAGVGAAGAAGGSGGVGGASETGDGAAGTGAAGAGMEGACPGAAGASGTSVCSTGLVCERLAPAACADPSWAEWPMPNGPSDVAAGAPNLASDTDHGDGTVTDNVTGLMWQKVAAAQMLTQAQALAYCPTLSLGGHADWRLPSLIELMSIVDKGQSNPSIDAMYFPATPATPFWSSTPVAGSTTAGWYVYFDYGNALTFDLTDMLGVRCVR